jgi:hypothetical protein
VVLIAFHKSVSLSTTVMNGLCVGSLVENGLLQGDFFGLGIVVLSFSGGMPGPKELNDDDVVLEFPPLLPKKFLPPEDEDCTMPNGFFPLPLATAAANGLILEYARKPPPLNASICSVDSKEG